MSDVEANNTVKEATANSLISAIGKLSRRIVVAVAGALGYVGADVADSFWGKAAAFGLAVTLGLIAEYFSAKHDKKIVTKAVDIVVEAAKE